MPLRPLARSMSDSCLKRLQEEREQAKQSFSRSIDAPPRIEELKEEEQSDFLPPTTAVSSRDRKRRFELRRCFSVPLGGSLFDSSGSKADAKEEGLSRLSSAPAFMENNVFRQSDISNQKANAAHEEAVSPASFCDDYWAMPTESSVNILDEDEASAEDQENELEVQRMQSSVSVDYDLDSPAENTTIEMENATPQVDLSSQSTPQIALPKSAHGLKTKLKQEATLQKLLEYEDWDRLFPLIQEDPGLCRTRVHMLCQGEKTQCLPLHAVVGRKRACFAVVDAILTAYPKALMQKDQLGGRLPVHMALLRGAPVSIVRYLCCAQPQALQQADFEGNLPMHYAAQYSSEEVIRLLFESWPAACKHANGRDRLPFHILCSRCWDHDMVSLNLMKRVLKECADACKRGDRNGRLPLHVACEQPNPRWDVLQLLVESHSPALLVKDQSKRTPLQLIKRRHIARPMTNDNDVVTAFLQERTTREKRKQYRQTIDKLFTIRASPVRHPCDHCYG